MSQATAATPAEYTKNESTLVANCSHIQLSGRGQAAGKLVYGHGHGGGCGVGSDEGSGGLGAGGTGGGGCVVTNLAFPPVVVVAAAAPAFIAAAAPVCHLPPAIGGSPLQPKQPRKMFPK